MGKAIIFEYNDLVQFTNNFSEENRLGEGGFADVYVGNIPPENNYGLLEEKVAIKKIKTRENSDRHYEIEKKWLTEIEHPNFVKLIGFCFADQPRCLVLEYVSRGTLTRCIQDLKWKNVKNILLKLGESIGYIHSIAGGYLHGDVKSDNVLITETMEPKLSDFGTFMLVADHVAGHFPEALTRGYFDPEFSKRGRNRKQSDDTYAFGVIMLQLLMKSDRSTMGSHEAGPNLEVDSRDHIDKSARKLFAEKGSIVHESLMRRGCSKREAENISALAIDLTQTSTIDIDEAGGSNITKNALTNLIESDATLPSIFEQNYYIERPTIFKVLEKLKDLKAKQKYQEMSMKIKL